MGDHVQEWRVVAGGAMLELLPEEKLIGTFLNCAPRPRHSEQYAPHQRREKELDRDEVETDAVDAN